MPLAVRSEVVSPNLLQALEEGEETLGVENSESEDELELCDYTSQQDFGTRKFYCVSNVTFHAESKYAIKIFPSPTVCVQWPF